jgi:hypothetical protein
MKAIFPLCGSPTSEKQRKSVTRVTAASSKPGHALTYSCMVSTQCLNLTDLESLVRKPKHWCF